MHRKTPVLFATTLLAVLFASRCSRAITSAHQRTIDRIATGIQTAGKLYTQKEYDRCATIVGGAQRLIDELLETNDAEIVDELRPLHRMLTKAHALLSDKGVDLEPLTPFPGAQADAAAVQLDQVAALVSRGGVHFNQKQFAECAEAISAAQSQLLQLGSLGPGASYERAQKLHAMIAKAHELLSDKDVELPELQPIQTSTASNLQRPIAGDVPPGAMQAEATGRPQGVSFARDVAPIFLRHCQQCHIRDSRGDFSLANYESMMRNTDRGPAAIAPGRPESSRLLELVESGEMPPQQRGRANPVPAADVARIRAWIEQGAPFDGSSRTLPIDQVIAEAQRRPPANSALAIDRGGPMRRPDSSATVPGRPTEGGSGALRTPAAPPQATQVSFSTDVVPVIMNSCGTCHMRSNQGDVSMGTFADLTAERANGAIVDAANPDGSQIIKLVEGEDLTHAGLLRGQQLDLVKTWLQQGAEFDGSDRTTRLERLPMEAQRARQGR